MTDASEIEAVRRDLAAWSAGKPKAVQRAYLNLDGCLATSSMDADATVYVVFGQKVNILACTARAVETLRSAA